MSYIPFDYLGDFLEFIGRRRDIFEVLTYRDLDWNDDWDHIDGYPGEEQRWKESLAGEGRDPGKAYIFLQHDVDSVPERTIGALRIEEQFGLRSNVMIFNRRIDRRHLRATGELRYTDYIQDNSYLKALEAKGFVIAYHCNAYERSGFSRPEAERILREDVDQLSRYFSIDFMSAHGGPPGPDGKSNNSLELPIDLRRRVRWVHNGYSIFVDGSYSDGGINSGKRSADKFDLRRFVQSMRPGRRYRVLVHPQYYTQDVEPNPRLKSPWYDEVLESYARAPRRNLWENLALGAAAPDGNWRQRVKRFVHRLSRH